MPRTARRTERVVFIEYREGRPFEVVTIEDDGEIRGRNYYDVEYCKRDKQLYYHFSGGGGTEALEPQEGVVFWTAPDFPVKPEPGAVRRKRATYRKKLEEAFNGQWFDGISESECEYCPVCDDHLPTEDVGFSLCDHVWWCDDTGWWSKPGERCPWNCPECRRLHLEVEPQPPILILESGYGIASSRLATITRRVLHRRKFTPFSLANYTGWCDEGTEAIEAARDGKLHRNLENSEVAMFVADLGNALGFSEAEKQELTVAILEAKRYGAL